MRYSTPALRPIGLFLTFALLVVAVEIFFVQSAAFGQHTGWSSFAVTADLAVGLPVLYYVLTVRRLNVSPRTVLVIFAVALGITALILPANSQQYGVVLQRLLMGVEVILLGYALTRVNRVVHQYRQLSRVSGDFIGNVTQSLDATLGRSLYNRLVANELAVLRYGLFGWWGPVEKADTDVAFTSHRASGQVALTAGLIGVGLIETIVLHLLVSRWNGTAAWFLSAIGTYGLLFFVADLVAVIKRPVLVRGSQILLRFGLRGYGVVDRHQLQRVTGIYDKPERKPATLTGTLLATPNVLITLRQPVLMTGPLGWQKMVTQIAFFIDDKSSFIHNLTA